MVQLHTCMHLPHSDLMCFLWPSRKGAGDPPPCHLCSPTHSCCFPYSLDWKKKKGWNGRSMKEWKADSLAQWPPNSSLQAGSGDCCFCLRDDRHYFAGECWGNYDYSLQVSANQPLLGSAFPAGHAHGIRDRCSWPRWPLGAVVAVISMLPSGLVSAGCAGECFRCSSGLQFGHCWSSPPLSTSLVHALLPFLIQRGGGTEASASPAKGRATFDTMPYALGGKFWCLQ